MHTDSQNIHYSKAYIILVIAVVVVAVVVVVGGGVGGGGGGGGGRGGGGVEGIVINIINHLSLTTPHYMSLY